MEEEEKKLSVCWENKKLGLYDFERIEAKFCEGFFC